MKGLQQSKKCLFKKKKWLSPSKSSELYGVLTCPTPISLSPATLFILKTSSLEIIVAVKISIIVATKVYKEPQKASFVEICHCDVSSSSPKKPIHRANHYLI